MTGDEIWYEAAQVVGITSALNVAVDGLGALGPIDESAAPVGTRALFAEMRRLGFSERGVMEVVRVIQRLSSYTKISDTLQLEPDMDDIGPVDTTPAPGGPER